jgi:hypothetical protein
LGSSRKSQRGLWPMLHTAQPRCTRSSS